MRREGRELSYCGSPRMNNFNFCQTGQQKHGGTFIKQRTRSVNELFKSDMTILLMGTSPFKTQILKIDFTF